MGENKKQRVNWNYGIKWIRRENWGESWRNEEKIGTVAGTDGLSGLRKIVKVIFICIKQCEMEENQ